MTHFPKCVTSRSKLLVAMLVAANIFACAVSALGLVGIVSTLSTRNIAAFHPLLKFQAFRDA